jgi:hypothetical protein
MFQNILFYFTAGGRWANHVSKSQAEKKEDLMRRNSIDGVGSVSQKSVIGIGESDSAETGSRNEVFLSFLFILNYMLLYFLYLNF